MEPHLLEDSPRYEVVVEGQLEPSHWEHWFEGFTVTVDPDRSITIVSGPVEDRAAFYGMIYRFSELALVIRSINRVDINERHSPVWWVRWLILLLVAGGGISLAIFAGVGLGLHPALTVALILFMLAGLVSYAARFFRVT